MVYPAAWVRIPLAPPVAGSLPDDLRGWGIPQPEMKMLSSVLVLLGSPTCSHISMVEKRSYKPSSTRLVRNPCSSQGGSTSLTDLP